MPDRYNRFVKKLLVLPLASLLFLASCAKDIQNPEAVKQGVMDYLKQRSAEIGIDMNAMNVSVSSLSFEKDVARAAVSFAPKGVPVSSGMTMNYVLDRKGDKWVVRGRQTNAANPHGGGQALPGTQPGTEAQPGALPPGHPPADGSGATGTFPRSSSDRIETMKTVAVLGGGPAGSFAAERLAQAGLRTIIFDEKLAWEKPCGGGLTYKAYREYPYLIDNATPKKLIYETSLSAPKAGEVSMRLNKPLVIYSRMDLNGMLLKRAEKAGAEIEKTRVLGIERCDDGWRLQTRCGTAEADFCVVATGARNSLRDVKHVTNE